MTDGVTINGLYSLTNEIVEVMIGGLDCGDYTVDSDGKVFVAYGSDVGGLMTPSYLNSISDIPGGTRYGERAVTFTITNGASQSMTVIVPVVVGYKYDSRMQLLRPVAEGDTKDPTGPGTGKNRRVHQASFQFVNTMWPLLGTAFTTNDTTTPPTGPNHRAVFTTTGNGVSAGPAVAENALFSDIWVTTIDDDYSFDGEVTVQSNRGWPLTIVSITTFSKTSPR